MFLSNPHLHIVTSRATFLHICCWPKFQTPPPNSTNFKSRRKYKSSFYTIDSKLILHCWKMVVGRLLSYWEVNFSGAILNFGGGGCSTIIDAQFKFDKRWIQLEVADFVFFLPEEKHPPWNMIINTLPKIWHRYPKTDHISKGGRYIPNHRRLILVIIKLAQASMFGIYCWWTKSQTTTWDVSQTL